MVVGVDLEILTTNANGKDILIFSVFILFVDFYFHILRLHYPADPVTKKQMSYCMVGAYVNNCHYVGIGFQDN